MAANHIKAWRKTLGLSQEALAVVATDAATRFSRAEESAEPFSWGRTDVNRYENGKREPPLAFVRAVAVLCAVTIDDVLNRHPSTRPRVPAHLQRVDQVWSELADEDLALSLLRQLPRKG